MRLMPRDCSRHLSRARVRPRPYSTSYTNLRGSRYEGEGMLVCVEEEEERGGEGRKGQY